MVSTEPNKTSGYSAQSSSTEVGEQPPKEGCAGASETARQDEESAKGLSEQDCLHIGSGQRRDLHRRLAGQEHGQKSLLIKEYFGCRLGIFPTTT